MQNTKFIIDELTKIRHEYNVLVCEHRELEIENNETESSNRRWVLTNSNRILLNEQYRELVINYKQMYLEIKKISDKIFYTNIQVIYKTFIFTLIVSNICFYLIFTFYDIIKINIIMFISGLCFFFVQKENILTFLNCKDEYIKFINKNEFNNIRKIKDEIKILREALK